MAVDPARLRAVFLEEFEERHRTLQDGLLELERDPSAAPRLLPELFRAAHSLKGGAHAVRMPAVATRCHRLEEVLGGVRDGEIALTPAVHGSLLTDVDALAALVAEQAAGAPEDGAAAPRPSPDSPTGTTVSESGRPPEPADVPLSGPPGDTRASGAVPRPSRPALRVPAERLDALLDRAGDVLLVRDRLVELARATDDLSAASAATDRRWQEVRPHIAHGMAPRPGAAVAAAERTWRGVAGQAESIRAGTAATARLLQDAASDLEHRARALRLQPFQAACDGLARAVRDLTRGPGTDRGRARLIIHDGDVELDGEVVAALRDPLSHLVRNAIAHGIEPLEDRRRAGKPETGTVTISATVLGDQVEVRVTDDGAGLDLDALRAGALGRGVEPDDDDEAVARLAWLPGLSTAATPDELAGRGVGLDAVRSSIERLGGTAVLDSTAGQGCTVTLLLPVTLSTLHALIVEVADQTLVLPSVAVRRVVRLPSSTITTTSGGSHVMVDDELADLVSLRTFLGLAPAPAEDHLLGVLVNGTNGPAVLVVDSIVAARRVTRRQLHPRLAGSPGVLGITMLHTGEAAFVLNPVVCVRDRSDRPFASSEETVEPDRRTVRVLLAEDSATTRALEQDILQRAGYEVLVATDGAEAWRLLREHGADLIVSDVEMPNMDGFELCRTIRAHPRFSRLPVVLVTSRASDEDRHRGVEAGANAYLVKGAFDQTSFLATIGRLL
jgi:two-component system chemotaxis sensor kinase CheA